MPSLYACVVPQDGNTLQQRLKCYDERETASTLIMIFILVWFLETNCDYKHPYTREIRIGYIERERERARGSSYGLEGVKF